MEISDVFTISLVQLLARTPILIFWIAVIVFGSVMLGRGGGRAERFLITGAIIKIAGNVLSIPSPVITNWLIGEGYKIADISTLSTSYSILLGIVSAAGTVCLIYAFWVKFKEWKTKETDPLILERITNDTDHSSHPNGNHIQPRNQE